MKYCEFFKKKCEYIEDGFKCSKADSINIKIAIKCNDFKRISTFILIYFYLVGMVFEIAILVPKLKIISSPEHSHQ